MKGYWLLVISETKPDTEKPNQTDTSGGKKMVKPKVSVFTSGVTERFLSHMGDAERERRRRVEKRDRHGGGYGKEQRGKRRKNGGRNSLVAR